MKKLDVQLANQIAAGEVVERPASVVKELLENSLDAGANRIDIEILSGGTSLIRIRDNGSGIPKEELELALSPHATSKISSLEDLDAIRSFGFRGEALSSICSISKFNLSSRIKNADQGWQAETEGRDMQVKLTPVAVAEGTRIDVRELFFNTPARRRFLRTEKTEYSHIEEVVKKVALANYSVAITLKHNGRISRRFRAADDLLQKEQRVAAVCGRRFMQRSIRLDLEHQGVELSGWLALPDFHKSQTDGQYFYVNNRSVRDKVLNHAIRQAYQEYIPHGRVPAYVLYLSLDPAKVDVNVHPTKHEVRFHDGRFIHDLLVQAIERGLNEGKELIDKEFLETTEQYHSETIARNTYPDTKVHMDTGSSSENDSLQHQAYRTLLQAATIPQTYQGVNEKGISEKQSELQPGDWYYLTRINDQYLLLEKEQQLVLLSVPNLLQQSLENKSLETQGGETSKKTEVLLFPEFLQCFRESDAESIACFLDKKDIKSVVLDSRISIEKVPVWMTSIAVKSFCVELIRSSYQKDIKAELVLDKLLLHLPTEQEIITMLLQLLIQFKDVDSLGLKKISKQQLLELFE
ncbi:MAG: DNA mismatch repair endonuclease MutL [Gammaproteobacteria bacterium]|nr:DNA mismatch repair endonuclease MutL [Gammaproteobacteria bacterium]